MKEINVSLNGVRPYVGLITGADERYGFALNFLPLKKISRTLHSATITAPGNYKIMPGAVVASRRIDTGFISVSADGIVTEIAAPKN